MSRRILPELAELRRAHKRVIERENARQSLNEDRTEQQRRRSAGHARQRRKQRVAEQAEPADVKVAQTQRSSEVEPVVGELKQAERAEWEQGVDRRERAPREVDRPEPCAQLKPCRGREPRVVPQRQAHDRPGVAEVAGVGDVAVGEVDDR